MNHGKLIILAITLMNLSLPSHAMDSMEATGVQMVGIGGIVGTNTLQGSYEKRLQGQLEGYKRDRKAVDREASRWRDTRSTNPQEAKALTKQRLERLDAYDWAVARNKEGIAK